MGIIQTDAAVGKAVLGLRIESLSEHAGVRRHVLRRLGKEPPDHPFVVASSIVIGQTTFDLVGDDISVFAPNLGRVVGGNAETRYRNRNDGLADPGNQDTPENRNRFFQWWAGVEPLVDDLEGQLRRALITLLAKGPFTVEWWPDLTGPNDPPAKITAEPPDDPTILVFHTPEEAVERVS